MVQKFALVYRHPKGLKPEYYLGMICGLITQISDDQSNAKTFETEQEARNEREKFDAHLRSFQVETVSVRQ